MSEQVGAEQGVVTARTGTGHVGLHTRQTPPDQGAALMDELDFLKAWEQGRIPFLGAMVRVRQIRRANLALGSQLAPVR